MRTVDRKGRAGERCRAEWHRIHAPAAVGETLPIAQQHLEPGEEVVAEGDGLRGLQVREAGHDGSGIGFRSFKQGFAKAHQFCVETIDCPAQPEADIGGDLVVSGAAGVQLLAGIPNKLREPRLDVHVDVFARDRPGKFVAFDFARDHFQAAEDRVALRLVEYTDLE